MVALGYEVVCIAIENVHVLWFDVNMAEEVLPHEAVVALRMVFWQIHILVHVECDYILEGNLSCRVHVNQVAVQPKR